MTPGICVVDCQWCWTAVMSGVVFCDVETTGLDPARHDVWEIALIADGTVYSAHVKPDLAAAEPNALRLNRFYERWADEKWKWTAAATVAGQVAATRRDSGHSPAGTDPSDHLGADAGRCHPELRCRFLDRLVCVESLAAGHLGILPAGLSTMAEKLGVAVDPAQAHTALGDARVALAVYRAVMEAKR